MSSIEKQLAQNKYQYDQKSQEKKLIRQKLAKKYLEHLIADDSKYIAQKILKSSRKGGRMIELNLPYSLKSGSWYHIIFSSGVVIHFNDWEQACLLIDFQKKLANQINLTGLRTRLWLDDIAVGNAGLHISNYIKIRISW